MLLVFFNGQVVNAARADGGRSLRSEDDPVGMILEDLGVFRRLVIEGRDIHGAGEFVLDGAGVVVEARGGGAGGVLFVGGVLGVFLPIPRTCRARLRRGL